MKFQCRPSIFNYNLKILKWMGILYLKILRDKIDRENNIPTNNYLTNKNYKLMTEKNDLVNDLFVTKLETSKYYDEVSDFIFDENLIIYDVFCFFEGSYPNKTIDQIIDFTYEFIISLYLKKVYNY